MTDDVRWPYVVFLLVMWSVILGTCMAVLPLHVVRMVMLVFVTVGALNLLLGYSYLGLWLISTAMCAHVGPIVVAFLERF
jgi:hypothetical protein